jgi:hypothetical protein
MIRQTRRMTRKRNPECLGSTRGSRVGLKAWPSLRVRCSGGSPKHSFLTEGHEENED